MLNYSWSEGYSVGNTELDKHHQTLLEMFNSISEQLGKDADKDTLIKLINDLKDYTEYHFKAEEEMMTSVGYEDFDAHIEKHAVFIHEVDEARKKLEADPDIVIEDLFIFLSSWLINHIQKTDMSYKGQL